MILGIKTDQPEAELYVLQPNGDIKDNVRWHADRKLADDILEKISALLTKNDVSFSKLTGIVVFTGRGSFTGLRIGTSVANALAYGLNIAVYASQGDEWLADGVVALLTGPTKVGSPAKPIYEMPPHITRPR